MPQAASVDNYHDDANHHQVLHDETHGRGNYQPHPAKVNCCFRAPRPRPRPPKSPMPPIFPIADLSLRIGDLSLGISEMRLCLADMEWEIKDLARKRRITMTPDEFSERLWDFAVQVAELIERLPDTRVGRHVAGQLLRCGTSSAPNYDESRSAESSRDFVHKLGVATKEMRETRGWLRFIVKLKLPVDAPLPRLIDESEQLLRMLSKSVRTARRRRPPPNPPQSPNPQSPNPQCPPNPQSPMPPIFPIADLSLRIGDLSLGISEMRLCLADMEWEIKDLARKRRITMTPDEFSERLWDFAVQVAELIERLPDTRVGRHVAGQLLRCGTSSAPNYDESRSAESSRDFVHKLGVATKEMRETRGWLRFIVKLKLPVDAPLPRLIDESEQLLRMLSKSVRTARRRRPPPNP
jgi:four helix bundle protein